MRAFEYASPETVEEVIGLLRQDGGAEDAPYPASLAGETRPLAGGTDLLPLIKADVAAPSLLLNLKRIEALPRGIEETGDGLVLGALTSLSEIERSPLIRERCPLLAEATEVAATPQLRNMATLGGNLLQRPRCWYFRNRLFHCWLKGGAECHARDGENQQHALFGNSPCVAVHPSDLAPALLALDAEVRLTGPNGERTLPLGEFYALPEPHRRNETTPSEDELILSVHIPPQEEGTRGTYLKAMDRKVWAFALVSAAARLRVQDGRITMARLVLGGVAPIPWRLETVEGMLVGQAPTPDLFRQAAEAALADARPLAHNGYKVPLAKTLVRRALEGLTMPSTTHDQPATAEVHESVDSPVR